ncbi:hypothetical protein [Rhizobium phage RHEph12]|nr:hypothetical protein [Rhizobium phage RHEph12]
MTKTPYNYMDAILTAGYVFRCGAVEGDNGFKGALPYYYVQIARNHRVFEAMEHAVYGQDYINAQAHTLVEAFSTCIDKWNDTATAGVRKIDKSAVYPDIETMIAAIENANVYYRITRSESHTAVIGGGFDNVQSFQGVYSRDYFICNSKSAGEALYLAICAWNDFHGAHRPITL